MTGIILGGESNTSGSFPKIKYSKTVPTERSAPKNEIVIVNSTVYRNPAYVISSEPPTQRADGKPLVVGDIWVNATMDKSDGSIMIGGVYGIRLRLLNCRIYDNTNSAWKPVESYIFNKSESEWVLISKATLYLITNGVNTSEIGNVFAVRGTYNQLGGYLFMYDAGLDGFAVSFDKLITLTGFNKIKITATCTQPKSQVGMYAGFSNDTGILWGASGLDGLFISNGRWLIDDALGNKKIDTDKTLEFELPTGVEKAYFKLYGSGSNVKIKSIELE